MIDYDEGSAVGFTALYDKSVSIDQIKSAINKRYGKWALTIINTPQHNVWRVEHEKFAISLATKDDGMKQLIYLAFQPLARAREDWIRAIAREQAATSSGHADGTPCDSK
jgi:hypothetical protein